jgi:hypothetical protein
MQTQTLKAFTELTSAQLHLTEAMAALSAISHNTGYAGECVCGHGVSCRYHAGLISLTHDTIRSTGDILDAVRADLTNPKRVR